MLLLLVLALQVFASANLQVQGDPVVTLDKLEAQPKSKSDADVIQKPQHLRTNNQNPTEFSPLINGSLSSYGSASTTVSSNSDHSQENEQAVGEYMDFLKPLYRRLSSLLQNPDAKESLIDFKNVAFQLNAVWYIAFLASRFIFIESFPELVFKILLCLYLFLVINIYIRNL
jgi:hypothetical protein